MTTGEIRSGWNRFFHEPMPATTLSFYRIFYGLMLLAFAILISDDLLVWYGDKGVLPLAESKNIPAGGGLNLLHFLPNTDFSVRAFFGVFIVAAVGVTLGFCARTCQVIAWLCLVSLHHRNMMHLHSGDYLLRIISFWMMFANSGRAFSIDRLIRLSRGQDTTETPKVVPWPMRMIQLQVCLLYLDAFLWKIRGEPWLNGTAIYYSSRLVEFWRFPVPYVFEHMWTIKVMTWASLLIEFALGFLLWIKNLRYWILFAGVLLHAGIDWSMNIPLFAPILVSAYITWIAPEDISASLGWMRDRFNRLTRFSLAIPVFYDGKCSFCTRSVEVLRALDCLRRFRFVDMHLPAAKAEFPDLDLERGSMELLLRPRSGDWLGGFDAFRKMAWHLPVYWLVVPVLYLPPIPTFGRLLYQRIAARRYCLLPSASAPKSHE